MAAVVVKCMVAAVLYLLFEAVERTGSAALMKVNEVKYMVQRATKPTSGKRNEQVDNEL